VVRIELQLPLYSITFFVTRHSLSSGFKITRWLAGINNLISHRFKVDAEIKPELKNRPHQKKDLSF